MQLRGGRGPGSAYLMIEQHLLHVRHLISPRYHNITWGIGQVAALSLSYRLPGTIGAQELEVRLLQSLSPIFSVLSWGKKKVASVQGALWVGVTIHRPLEMYPLGLW